MLGAIFISFHSEQALSRVPDFSLPTFKLPPRKKAELAKSETGCFFWSEIKQLINRKEPGEGRR